MGGEHGPRHWCWGVIQVRVSASGGHPPPSVAPVLRMWSLGDGPQVSVSLEPSGSAASHPRWSQLLPLALSDFVPACWGRSIPQGPCQPRPRCPTTCQKLRSGEGPPISGLDSIFPRINSPSGFFESVFLLPLSFEALNNSLTLPPCFLELWLWTPKPHSQILCQINSMLTNQACTNAPSNHCPGLSACP